MAGRAISVCCSVIVSICGASVAPAATALVGGSSASTNALGGPPFASSAIFQAPKFPTYLGTLQSVTLEFRLNYTPEIAMFNSTLVEQTVVSASSSIPALVSYPGGEVEFTANGSFNTISPLLGFKIGASGPWGPVGLTFVDQYENASLPAFEIPANDLSAFIGPGMVDFNLHYGNGNASGSNSSIEYFASATAFAGVNITYDYVPVPEPSSILLAMLAAGSFGVVWMRKRVLICRIMS